MYSNNAYQQVLPYPDIIESTRGMIHYDSSAPTCNFSNGDNVRLIFNGRVLQGESLTLAEAGVVNNCVIHCLVHRNTPHNEREGMASRTPNRNENVVDISDLDLSNVCYPLFCFYRVRSCDYKVTTTENHCELSFYCIHSKYKC